MIGRLSVLWLLILLRFLKKSLSALGTCYLELPFAPRDSKCIVTTGTAEVFESMSVLDVGYHMTQLRLDRPPITYKFIIFSTPSYNIA